MHRLRRIFNRPRAVVLATVLAAAVGVGAASGVAAAAIIGHAGTSITRVSVITQDTAAVYSSTAWTTVGSTAIFASAGQFIEARFTAESACYGATTGWCSVRILVDGVEAEPVVGTDFAFNDAGSPSSWESLSVERVKSVSTTTTHTVTVQAASVGTLSDRLDDWTLTATAVAL